MDTGLRHDAETLAKSWKRRWPKKEWCSDQGDEYCGAPERHEYELYLAVENIDHTRTKTPHL